jgi:hypothetical protein
MSASTRAHSRRRIERSTIERTTPKIERIRAPVNRIVVGPILGICLRFVLRFLGFLGTYRVFLNSINRLINRELDTCDFGEELTALQGSVFRVYSFPFYFIL